MSLWEPLPVSASGIKCERMWVGVGWLVVVSNTSTAVFISDVDKKWSLTDPLPEPIVVPPVVEPDPVVTDPVIVAPDPIVVPPVVVEPPPVVVVPPVNTDRPVGTGLYVKGSKVFDANGIEFVMRGVNSTFAWGWKEHNFDSIPEIAKTKANTIRCVFSSNIGHTTVAEKDAIIASCLKNNLIPVLGLWDATGQTDEASIKAVFDFWLQPGHVALLKQYEKNVVLNPANEWGDFNDALFIKTYSEGIARLRAAGINCLVMVDASGAYGQNPRSILNAGNSILQADPNKNVMFSLHCYAYHRTDGIGIGSWNDNGTQSPWKTSDEVKKILAANLALVIGEIGWTQSDQVNYDTGTLLGNLLDSNVGFLAWSWNQNSDSMLDFFKNNSEYIYTDAALSAGGDLFVNNAKVGMKATSKLATTF